MEEVQRVRKLEKQAVADVKNANNIVTIRKVAASSDEAPEARIASVHALRRVLIYYVENAWSCSQVRNGDANSAKKKQYNDWFVTQYNATKDALLSLICGDNDQFHAVSIRTFIELMKYDYRVLLPPSGKKASVYFDKDSFKNLLASLIVSKNELDVDLLIMLKEEIFCYYDCAYHGLEQIKALMQEVKEAYQAAKTALAYRTASGSGISSSSSSGSSSDRIHSSNAAGSDSGSISIQQNIETITKNFIDMLRVMDIPEDDDDIEADNEDAWLLPGVLVNNGAKQQDGNNNSDDSDDAAAEDDSSDDEDRQARLLAAAAVDEKKKKEMDPLLAELAGLNRTKPSSSRSDDTDTRKRKRGNLPSSTFDRKQRRRKCASLAEKLQDASHYRKLFSRAWLTLLSLPALTPTQHKLLLRHLPEHVVPRLTNALLLADYLTQSFNVGGLVAVLALESLFELIVKHNLDYPDFFLSLYKLCTVEVFSAKYRIKFIKLLSSALKSVNIPVYVVAAFIKRLSGIALHTATPNARYCIAQCTWLLRQHPQSQVLIHSARGASSTTALSSSTTADTATAATAAADIYDSSAESSLEAVNALQSSLWEMECLQKLHLLSASTLALNLSDKASTASGRAAAMQNGGFAFLHVEDYLESSYTAMFDAEVASSAGAGAKHVAGSKPQAALAYKRINKLIADDGVVSKCFGR